LGPSTTMWNVHARHCKLNKAISSQINMATCPHPRKKNERKRAQPVGQTLVPHCSRGLVINHHHDHPAIRLYQALYLNIGDQISSPHCLKLLLTCHIMISSVRYQSVL
jgi:hypothetical protein